MNVLMADIGGARVKNLVTGESQSGAVGWGRKLKVLLGRSKLSADQPSGGGAAAGSSQ